jgi:hypothetical protein
MRQIELAHSQAFVLSNPGSPAFLLPAFDVAASLSRDEDQILAAFRSRKGMGWHEHNCRLLTATEAFFRNGYRAAPDPNMDSRCDRLIENCPGRPAATNQPQIYSRRLHSAWHDSQILTKFSGPNQDCPRWSIYGFVRHSNTGTSVSLTALVLKSGSELCGASSGGLLALVYAHPMNPGQAKVDASFGFPSAKPISQP